MESPGAGRVCQKGVHDSRGQRVFGKDKNTASVTDGGGRTRKTNEVENIPLPGKAAAPVVSSAPAAAQKAAGQVTAARTGDPGVLPLAAAVFAASLTVVLMLIRKKRSLR